MESDRELGPMDMEEVKDEIHLTVLNRDHFTPAESSDDIVRHGGEDVDIAPSRQSPPNITISRARAIALVATVTGASFLNVCVCTTHLVLHSIKSPPLMPTYLFTDPLRPSPRHHPSLHRERPLHSFLAATVDCLRLLACIWVLPPRLGPHRRPVWQAAHFHPRLRLGLPDARHQSLCAK